MRQLIEFGLVAAVGILVALVVASEIAPIVADLWEGIARDLSQALP